MAGMQRQLRQRLAGALPPLLDPPGVPHRGVAVLQHWDAELPDLWPLQVTAPAALPGVPANMQIRHFNMQRSVLWRGASSSLAMERLTV